MFLVITTEGGGDATDISCLEVRMLWNILQCTDQLSKKKPKKNKNIKPRPSPQYANIGKHWARDNGNEGIINEKVAWGELIESFECLGKKSEL